MLADRRTGAAKQEARDVIAEADYCRLAVARFVFPRRSLLVPGSLGIARRTLALVPIGVAWRMLDPLPFAFVLPSVRLPLRPRPVARLRDGRFGMLRGRLGCRRELAFSPRSGAVAAVTPTLPALSAPLMTFGAVVVVAVACHGPFG